MVEPFACRRCGHCCHGEGGIVLTERDSRRLAAYLEGEGQHGQAVLAAKSYVRNGKRYLSCGADGYCVFYRKCEDGAAGCGVHQARPDVCRAWPFFRGNLLDELSWRMIQQDCPGVDPAGGYAAFVRHGLDRLRDLAADDGDDAPNALRRNGLE